MKKIGILREIKNEELSLILTWRNSPFVKANMYSRHEISNEEHLAWWNKIKDQKNQKQFMYEQDGTPYGVVGFSQIDYLNKNAAWAFYAAPEAPVGCGSRMELLALDHAFDQLQLRKLYCEVLDFNKSVINLHDKFGFQIEGVFKSHHLYEEKFIDIIRLSILLEEWRAKRSEILIKLKVKGDQ
ncbi:UDP-4-amino-4,6-dideoxy-N-acetyl-beta-L-altrosamine N-acetyltransferase [Limnohabitans sp. INBF002]|uniref:UDP-4-amino-4, 6-dideoxy-N-acetyl-beta-L-altrosamine N-acetyltransferase n=1 Tax=Limnohabitans sp. INBF002 TaxID=2986280 RepID=UPI002376ED65|nr:UDP-4-amino-4,6-dideoxy-N-acetyl-beta-L-altrosamine N-acetyltransferase [Limnohabitans sp. INBF002]BDU52231.1 UDP-4-amino-4,6-dideoxy-N-acetyl-beta-L-altrosami ne N-acetyltransferase [Limnohabitans sp. INBF002]